MAIKIEASREILRPKEGLQDDKLPLPIHITADTLSSHANGATMQKAVCSV